MKRVTTALLLLAAWSIPGILTAAATVLMFPLTPTVRANIGLFLLASMSSWWYWALVTPVVMYLVRRYPIAAERRRDYTVKHVLAASVLSFGYVFWYAYTSWVTRPPTLAAEPFVPIVRGYVASRLAIGYIIYGTIVAVLVAMAERAGRHARELQEARLRGDLARAQLQSLQMQLQPHFMFNTLHAISMLVEENPAAATVMIRQLGDLLRRTLQLADVPEIPLEEELALLTDYLEIEETRFGDRLSVTVDVDPSLRTAMVPSFILQPLVENSIRHGIAPRVEGGSVAVHARRVDGRMQLEVSDDGPGLTGETSGGVGLSTTSERLAVRYGSEAELRIRNGVSGGTSVIVELPVNDG
jgi:two-component system, LytTR family, sensor kinase